MALDEATRALLAQMQAAGLRPLHELTVAQARELGPRLQELYGDGPDMARAADATIAAYDGAAFGARVLVPHGDRLRDEDEAFAARLEAAGVPVRHQRFDGQMHGFFTMVNVLPGHDRGLDYVAEAIDETLTARDGVRPVT